VDELFTQMCNTYEGLDWLFGVYKYRQRAAEYARSMCVFGSYSKHQYPAYVINKSDLARQQREEIELLATVKEKPDDIICDVIFRIYCSDSDLRPIYFRDIQGRKLRWRLED
jgi:hypothetical protein